MTQLLSVLIVAAAFAGLLYVMVRPHWVFVLVLVMLPFEQLMQVYLPFLGRFQSFVNYAIGMLAVGAVVTRIMRREPMLTGAANRGAVLTLCIYFLWFIGMFYSPAKDWLLEQLGYSLSYQVLFLAVLPLLVLDVFEFRRAMTAMMVLGAVICLLIMINPNSSYHSGRLVLDLGMFGGGVRSAGNPLALAELGGAIVLIAALMRPERITPLSTAMRVFAFVVGMGLAIGSGSRGQVLATGIAGVLVFPMSRRLSNPKQFFLLMIGFAIVAIGAFVTFKMFVGVQNEQRWTIWGMLRDTTLRMEMVWQLLDAYLAEPSKWLFGLGTNAYAHISFDRNTKYVHNLAAEMLCEHGIVGAILFVTLTVLTFRSGWRLWKMCSDDASMRSVVAVLLAICVFSLLGALKQGSLGYPQPFYWWLILTKLAAYEQKLAAAAAEAAEQEAELAIIDEDAGRVAGEGSVALG